MCYVCMCIYLEYYEQHMRTLPHHASSTHTHTPTHAHIHAHTHACTHIL